MPRSLSGIAKVKVLRGILKGALFQKRPLEGPVISGHCGVTVIGGGRRFSFFRIFKMKKSS